MPAETATRGRRNRRVLVPLGLVAASVLLLGCQPEPGLTASPSESSASASAPSPSTSPTSATTEVPAEAFALPGSCESLYSPAMLASLTAQNPPLNDPGVTMTSSQNVDALELLASGIPTIRCSWGQPSESGLATNVSIVDAAQSEALLAAFTAAGFGCEAFEGGTLCRIEQKTVDQDDNLVTIGEIQFVRGTGWVSTTTINFAPDGYTEDVVATLWG